MRPRRSRTASHDGWVVRPQAEDHGLLCLTGSVPGVGYWLQVRHGFIIGDALSRVSAAQTVLFSRDPHLAAIGFIFTPLTAMVQIPAIAISPLWPDMAERAFSGTIMSSIFMAGAVVQVFGMGADRGLPRAYSAAIAVLFAVNPMIVFYGSNGMSEAPFIFFMSWAVAQAHHVDARRRRPSFDRRRRHRHGPGLSDALRRGGVYRRRRSARRRDHVPT